ncbi:histidine kinase [Streptomyces sp. NPDC051940]|uniref:sensor histidine kinase n=1 Tax=Streptomyces sp. NPDC051940 TaxID=3155675 RepID=UPI003422112B
MVRRFPGGERVADVLLWVVITAPLLLSDDVDAPVGAEGLPLPWVKAAAVPLLAVAVWLSRRQPLAAVAVTAVLGLAVTPELHASSFGFAQAVLVYLMGRRAEQRRPALLFFAAVCVAGVLLMLPAARGPAAADSTTLVGNVLLVYVLPWLAGLYVRQRAELVRTGWELAERLEQEQELAADRVRLRERSRIAQDMHDTLGHDLTLIAVRAAALQVADDVGPNGRQAAAELRQAAASATRRLRQVVGLLREDAQGAPLRPADESVASLVERAVASGIPVRLDDRLGPGTDPLPPMTDRAVHRVVQEALTNAAKHAPGAAVTVTLLREGEQAAVTVANTAAPHSPGDANGDGYGLVGLDERVRQAGGTLRTRTGDGVFTVTARLPLTADAAVTPPGEDGRVRRQLDAASRTTRRRMLQTVWLPAAGVAALLALMIGYDQYSARGSVLDEEVYAGMRIGEPRAAVVERLPARRLRPENPPAAPSGTDECLLYRTIPGGPTPAYRLCFTDGRLSYKDKVALRE